MRESAYFIMQSVDGRHDVQDVQAILSALHGVSRVQADPQTGLVAVDYNSAGTSYDRMEACLNRIGCQIVADASNIHTR